MANVPTIDLNCIDNDALQALDLACRDHGFFFLKGHGLDALVEAVKTQAECFFALPRDEKQKVVRKEDNPMGYYDRELTKQKRDLKEVFDFYARSNGQENRMPWPQQPTEFKETLRAYFLANAELSNRVMHILCNALGVDETSFDRFFMPRHTSSARLNYYPSEDPLAADDQQSVTPLGDMALHHHTDQGAITLLFQDDIGGLQAFSKDAGWIDIPPMEDALVVNIGDIAQVWSNGAYQAALHRVLPIAAGKSRYSLPFFYQPSFDTVVAPHQDLGAPNYRSFNCGDFIQGRIDDNYEDLGADDIQVERFRINA